MGTFKTPSEYWIDATLAADLDLVEPGGVDGTVNEPQVLVAAFEAADGCLAAVGGAVVDDPEDPAGGGVGLGEHDLTALV